MAQSNAAQLDQELQHSPEGDVESRLDRLFGSETEQPEESEPEATEPVEAASEEAAPVEDSVEQTEPEYVDVEFEGETYSVPPKLKDALLMQRDYTSKTQAVANQRKELEIAQREIALAREARAFEEYVAPDLARMKLIDEYVAHVKKTTDWSSLSSDKLVKTRFEIDQLNDERTSLAQAIEAKRSEFTQKLDGERKKVRAEMAEHLSKAIPGWSDAVRSEVEQYAVAQGYPEAVVPNLSASDYRLLWKASQFDKLKSETKHAVKKAAESPVIKATARKAPMPKDVRAKLDLRNAVKTGKRESIDAAVDARLSNLFGG